MSQIKRLQTIDADTLQSTAYEPVSFVVDDLLPQGLHLLAGAPKIGKSWLALWLCLCAAQGKPLWTFATRPCEVLYLCLEDSFQRIQSRLFDLTEDAPPTLHFAVMSQQLHNGLVEQIEQFLKEHPQTRLIVIDTLQRIRTAGNDANPYASDYRDIGVLKALADKHRIAILLVHHLRKMNDDDPMNMISGTTGLSGATDSNFVLRKSKRRENTATLYCTGRDIPYRELALEFDGEDHVWKLLSDDCEQTEQPSERILFLLSELLRQQPEISAPAKVLLEKIDPAGAEGLTPNSFSHRIRKSVDALRRNGISVVSAVLSDAKRNEIIEKNPARMLDLPTPQRTVQRIPTRGEVKKLLDALAKEPRHYRLFYLLSMYTGCRRGELCALQWSDFTGTQNGLLLTVSRSRSSVPGKGIVEGSTKSGKSREVYLSSDLRGILLTYKRRKQMEADKQRRRLSPYLFTDEQGQLIHPDTFTKRLRKIYDAIGFPREYHLHTLRHYFVTSLLHCGVDKQTVADLVGHADTGFLERTYCHPQQAQKEQAADSMLTMLRPDGGQIFNLAACSPKQRSA